MIILNLCTNVIIVKIMKSNKIITGIQGFDELIEGGLNECDSILLIGGPGTGKTIFGLQYIVNGIKYYNEAGLIVLLKNQIEEIRLKLNYFGLNLDKLINRNQLNILDVSPIITLMENGNYKIKIKNESDTLIGDKDFNIREIISSIHLKRRKIEFKRVLIDSLMPLLLKYDDSFLFMTEFELLLKSLKKANMTSLILTENSFNNDNLKIATHLVDGVIKLTLSRYGNTKIRYLDIIKMSNLGHILATKLFDISELGIKILSDKKISLNESIETLDLKV